MNIIFDISNVYYRSYFKTKSYLTDDEKENKAVLVRKFFIDFSFICKSFYNVDKVICCFDSRSYRKDLSTEYKKTREKKEQYFYDALDEIKYILNTSGFIVLKHKGLEADDLIFLSSNIYINNCIISNDEDIRQYLNETTCNLVLQKDKNILYQTKENNLPVKVTSLDYTVNIIDPIEVTIKKLLLGCNSDIVPKLTKRGIGEKSLDKLLQYKNDFIVNSNLDLNLIINKYNEIFNESITFNQINNNMQLITLTQDFDDQIFTNSRYTYSRPFKMQEILQGTEYLVKNIE